MSTKNHTMNGLQSTRKTIFQALCQEADWCSGEVMAANLRISRAAVSKQVAALRLEGHVIEASPGRGYRLAHQAVPFDWETVHGGLATRRWGKGKSEGRDNKYTRNHGGMLWLVETPSTNTVAANEALAGALPGTVVIALHQGAGRGRKGHTWFTAPYSLAFSVILPSSLSVRDLETLTLAAAKAVARAIQMVTGADATVKQPNDVLVQGRKVAGVLMEMGLRGTETEWAVLGVGVNVNARTRDFPSELAAKATSLNILTERPVCRATLLQQALVELEAVFEPALTPFPV